MRTPDPKVNEKWSFRAGRGVGTYTVIDVIGGRVVLRPALNDRGRQMATKEKNISVRTLKKDYELVPRTPAS